MTSRKKILHLSIKILSFLGLLSLLFMSSCVEESKFLTPKERKYADSIILVKTKVLRVELDSVCDADFEKNVSAIVDSLLEVRIKEMKEILGQ